MSGLKKLRGDDFKRDFTGAKGQMTPRRRSQERQSGEAAAVTGGRLQPRVVSSIKCMFEVGAVTYAQPSITKGGRDSEMRKVMSMAQAFGVYVVPHSAYFSPGLLASMHCIAAMSRESLVERYACDFEANSLHDTIHPRDGRLGVPQVPRSGSTRMPR